MEWKISSWKVVAILLKGKYRRKELVTMIPLITQPFLKLISGYSIEHYKAEGLV